jgi:hypothetical protein
MKTKFETITTSPKSILCPFNRDVELSSMNKKKNVYELPFCTKQNGNGCCRLFAVKMVVVELGGAEWLCPCDYAIC